MPAISRLLIRTGAAWLVAGMALGVAAVLPAELLSAELLPAAARRGLSTAAVHLLAVGWITQLIFGVALWMFPRPGRPRSLPDRPLDTAAWALLNVGLAARLAVEPGWTVPTGGAAWRWALLASAAAQWAAVLYFAARLWPRVRSR